MSDQQVIQTKTGRYRVKCSKCSAVSFAATTPEWAVIIAERDGFFMRPDLTLCRPCAFESLDGDEIDDVVVQGDWLLTEEQNDCPSPVESRGDNKLSLPVAADTVKSSDKDSRHVEAEETLVQGVLF